VPDLAAPLRVLDWARPIGPAYPGSAADLHERAAYAEWVICGERHLPGCVEGTDMDGSAICSCGGMGCSASWAMGAIDPDDYTILRAERRVAVENTARAAAEAGDPR
jgi:hypothetical protein